jgi:biotin carboxyl carrier protein
MKAFRIQINQTLYNVSVEQTGSNRFQAILDGAKFEVESTSNGDIARWLVRSKLENMHAQAKSLPSDRVNVWLACTPFPATVQTLGIGGYSVVPEVRRKAAFANQVRALMPGRVTSVLVKEGEEIREGAPLLILEAMKMQNEITSPSNGKIKQVFVHEGENVKKDAVLVAIE